MAKTTAELYEDARNDYAAAADSWRLVRWIIVAAIALELYRRYGK